RLEDALEDFGRDARPAVHDLELDAFADDPRAHGDARRRRIRPLAVALDGLRRIVDEVDDDAAQAVGVDGDDGIAGAELADERDALGDLLFVENLGEPGIEREFLALQPTDARVVEEVRDDGVAPPDAALDPAERAVEREPAGLGGLGDGEHGVADDAERVAQLVADRRRQLAERRQALLAQELFLHVMQLGSAFADAALQLDLGLDLVGDVARRAAVAGETSVGAEDRPAADPDMVDGAGVALALELEIVEGAAGGEIGIVRPPLLLADAEMNDLAARLADML